MKLNYSLVASAAAVLDDKEIPFVLWSEFMLLLMGVPTFVKGFDFIVEDAFLMDAWTTLRDAGFKECDDNTCIAGNWHFAMPQPAMHLHISKDLYIGLYLKSLYLWTVPDLSVCDGENIIVASDPSLPECDHVWNPIRMPADLHPVRMPSVNLAFKTMILVEKRLRESDIELDQSHSGLFSVFAGYIEEYCTNLGVFHPEQLPMVYQKIMKADGAKAQIEAAKELDLGLPCTAATAVRKIDQREKEKSVFDQETKETSGMGPQKDGADTNTVEEEPHTMTADNSASELIQNNGLQPTSTSLNTNSDDTVTSDSQEWFSDTASSFEPPAAATSSGDIDASSMTSSEEIKLASTARESNNNGTIAPSDAKENSMVAACPSELTTAASPQEDELFVENNQEVDIQRLNISTSHIDAPQAIEAM